MSEVEALAAAIVAHLEALDDNDCPYVDASDLKSTLIDGRVDMIALSEAIIQHQQNRKVNSDEQGR